MTGESSEPKVWSRQEAISELRRSLLKLADEEHSMCQVAAERGIFCQGFRRWHDAEFDRRWKGLLGRSTHLSRAQIEQLANVWQLAEQVRHRVTLACDAQTLEHGACRGWDEFGNDAIAGFCAISWARTSSSVDPTTPPV